MAIQTDCRGCGALLSVESFHAGKSAQCPQCGYSYVVPRSQHDHHKSERLSQWELQTPEGKTYGPVDRATLDRWTAEGRVDADCLLRRGASAWCNADQIYQELRTEPQAPLASPFAAADDETPPVLPILSYMEPHRGALILGLGVAGFLVPCPMLSIVAWGMGNHDLRKMQAGRMDPNGYSLTQAGRVFGLVFSVLWLFAVALAVVACMFLIAVS